MTVTADVQVGRQQSLVHSIIDYLSNPTLRWALCWSGEQSSLSLILFDLPVKRMRRM